MSEPTATALYVNLATPEAAESVAASDVDGVGLLRAEFMITGALGGKHPTAMVAAGRRDEYVDEMAAGVEHIAGAFAPRRWSTGRWTCARTSSPNSRAATSNPTRTTR